MVEEGRGRPVKSDWWVNTSIGRQLTHDLELPVPTLFTHAGNIFLCQRFGVPVVYVFVCVGGQQLAGGGGGGGGGEQGVKLAF